MSEAIKDGGPVHPVRLPVPGATHISGDPIPTELHTGKSLRDHFAGLAMQAFLCGYITRYGHEGPHLPCAALASEAFDMADEMIRVREKGPSS